MQTPITVCLSQWAAASATFQVLDINGNPLNLAGKTLELVVTPPASPQIILWTWGTSDFTLSIGGTGNSFVTIADSDTHTQSAGDVAGFLWDVTAGRNVATMLAPVIISITEAPQPPPVGPIGTTIVSISAGGTAITFSQKVDSIGGQEQGLFDVTQAAFITPGVVANTLTVPFSGGVVQLNDTLKWTPGAATSISPHAGSPAFGGQQTIVAIA